MINQFSHRYKFLSNFYECEVPYEGTTYWSVEHAYQAAKFDDPAMKVWIARSPTPWEAKANARGKIIRADWNEVRLPLMDHLVRIKFTHNANLRQRLLDTGDELLIEQNDHGDKFWGVSHGEGLNHLGIILMKLRLEFRQESTTEAS